MSIITIQYGQCGNQIGTQLFSTICKDNNHKNTGVSQSSNEQFVRESTSRFFEESIDGNLTARAVLVDMESKAIEQSLKSTGRHWRYDPSNCVAHKTGSGNNWALGYTANSEKILSSVLDCVRREVEKCDGCHGFLSLMSLAGGTGSGVGARLTECIREEYPTQFMLNQVTWPFSAGEVIVQNYNALLTLAHLYTSSDAIITFENDKIQQVCAKRLHLKEVSFDDLNRVICHQLSSVFQPCGQSQSPIADIPASLVSHPGYKLLTLRTIPQVTENVALYNADLWPALLKHLRQMLIVNSALDEGMDWTIKTDATSNSKSTRRFLKCLSNLLVCRGLDSEIADSRPFSDAKLYPVWTTSSVAHWNVKRRHLGFEKIATVMSNSQAPCAVLDRVVGSAWNMFACRAYLHQYTRNGISEEDFVSSFASVEQILANYNSL